MGQPVAHCRAVVYHFQSDPAAPTFLVVNQLSPKKLLLSKWTALRPQNAEKHFIVTRVIPPEPASLSIEWVEIEAVYSGAVREIRYRELRDQESWRQGWV